MSKVIKDGIGFVPEKIIAVDLDQPAVWHSLVPETSTDTNEYGQTASPPPTDNEPAGDDENDAQDQDPSYTFDSDFSSPEVPDDQEGTLDVQHSEPQEDEPEPIDIEALTQEFYNKGVQAGIARMESDYGSSIKTLQSVCEQLNSVRETILRNSLEEMQNLVLLIAEKVIRHSVASQKQTIVKTVEEAIQLAVKSDEFIIRVNPGDHDLIKDRSADFINSVSGLENVIIKSDGSVEQGGCLIESNNCTVDATLASQLSIITDAVKKK